MFNRTLKLKISLGTIKDKEYDVTEEFFINDLRTGELNADFEKENSIKVGFIIENSVRSGNRGMNTAEISIYNLSQETRIKIEKFGLLVEVIAGYEGNTGVIFGGEINNVGRSREGTDIITRLYCVEAIQSLSGNVSKAIESQNLTKFLEEICSDNGIKYDIESFNNIIANTTFNGTVEYVLYQLSLTFPICYYVFNHVLYVRRIEGDTNDIVELSKSSGLISLPEINEQGVKLRCFINPSIRIGRYIRLNSEYADFSIGDMNFVKGRLRGVIRDKAFVGKGDQLNGDYYVLSMQTRGDNRSNLFQMELTCQYEEIRKGIAP